MVADLLVVDCDDRAACRSRGSEREVAVRGIPDRERLHGRCCLDARDAPVVCEGLSDRARPSSLAGDEAGGAPRRRALCAWPLQSPAPAWRRACRRRPGRPRRPEAPSRAARRPRTRSSSRPRSHTGADSRSRSPREECAELELDSPAVVVRSSDGEDVRTRVTRGDRGGLASLGGEDDRLETCRRGCRGDRVAEVPGRRAAKRRHAVVECGGGGERGDAILVRTRRVGAFELQPEIDAESSPQARRFDERGPARSVFDMRARREQCVVRQSDGARSATDSRVTATRSQS